MNKEEAKEDAAKHYDMSEWLNGNKDSIAGIKHKDLGDSYNAGYSFGIFEQEQDSGVYG